jgi:hypothetical protein
MNQARPSSGCSPPCAVAGEAAGARDYTDQALAAAEKVADEGDRDLVLADLETIPGQPRYW